jgi:hypothetical protein
MLLINTAENCLEFPVFLSKYLCSLNMKSGLLSFIDVDVFLILKELFQPSR